MRVFFYTTLGISYVSHTCLLEHKVKPATLVTQIKNGSGCLVYTYEMLALDYV
jgi:hypothetical protein